MKVKQKIVNSTYAKAYTEVLEIIKYFSKEDYNKIPSKKIWIIIMSLQ